MGMPMLKRFMSMQSERRHRQIRARARAGCVSSSLAKRKKEVCQHDDVSPSDKRLRCSGVNLPEPYVCDGYRQEHMGLLEEKDRVMTYDVAVHVHVKLLVDDQPHAQLDNAKNFLRYPCQEA
ncbi:uncharacterized protein [Aegilops tauschii subsp. strangulata]|uniref:uncharacterized protein isoform X4 n=1 Tax=Aegilops tauschii subsp. strangulata TaxID=200361 RepID=UPI00098A908E|nr:uncharacterized protein LOC109760183 isoform X4 [Aegilops tauschii subsp. strangulata]XP_044437717.1 uncharacterized protein LOC123164346 isoform X3 [Triticum aestivum]